MRFRSAFEADVFSIIRLFQKSGTGHEYDELFQDYRKLEKALRHEDSLWVIGEIDGAPRSMISMLIEKEQRICKITRMLVDPDTVNPRAVLRHTLKYVLDYVQVAVGEIDLVYTTTLSMSMQLQGITLEEGFKILGVFPNLMGEDNSQLNGLTGYFYKGVLSEKRQAEFTLHHRIEPFFKISQRQCQLPDLPVADEAAVEEIITKYGGLAKSDESPPLEMINAPQFVSRRFVQHKLKHSQLVNFYPFYAPNCLITDPTQETEIFVKVAERMRFAAIIGEHLERSLNPVELYLSVQQILKNFNVSYIEIINDAADVFGIECFLRAGFTPCAYFPAFKRQGDTRRDYVVFGKSFEYLCRPDLDTHRAYIEFYREYFNLEGINYFPRFPNEIKAKM